mmetsp:Transcript_138911/g.432158  ORF Transcript_138911/g.432158 Transcript_138911/m.432158 type:complete len:209 (+) Transcript_138911:518-1144(+)
MAPRGRWRPRRLARALNHVGLRPWQRRGAARGGDAALGRQHSGRGLRPGGGVAVVGDLRPARVVHVGPTLNGRRGGRLLRPLPAREGQGALRQCPVDAGLGMYGHVVAAALDARVELDPLVQRHLVAGLQPPLQHQRGVHKPVQAVGAQEAALQLQAGELAARTEGLQVLRGAHAADVPALALRELLLVLPPPEVCYAAGEAVHLLPV